MIFISCSEEGGNEDLLQMIAESNKPDCLVFSESGDNQTGNINAAMPEPLKVSVKDNLGQISVGKEVNFAVISGAGATLSEELVLSNSEGIAETTLSIGEIPGVYKVSAVCSSSAILFSATAVDPEIELKACNLALKSGNEQIAEKGNPLPNPLEILATDVLGNPLAEATVNFTITQGEGASLDVETMITAEDGLASTTLTLGPEPGLYTVEATCEDDSIAFTAIASDRDFRQCIIVKEDGDDQIGDLSDTLSPLKIIAEDNKGNRLVGAPITFTVNQGEGASLTENNVFTDENGEASTTFTLGPAEGDYQVMAVCSASVVIFYLKAIDLINSCQLTHITAKFQETPVGTILEGGLKVQAFDGLGNIAEGRSVTFGISEGAGVTLGFQPVITNEYGLAATSVVIGPFETDYKIGAFCGDSSVDFTITGTKNNGFPCEGQKPFFLGLGTAVALDSSRIRLSWTLASDLYTPQKNIEYQIYKTDVGPEMTNFDLTSPNKTFSNNTNSYTFTGLPENTQYWFLVKARNVCGEMDENEIVQTATTGVYAGPTFAGISDTEAIDADSIKISWPEAIDDNTAHIDMTYKIYAFSDSDSSNYEFGAPIATVIGVNETQINGLQENHYAWYVVHAMNEAGWEDENYVAKLGTVKMILQANTIGSHNWNSGNYYNQDSLQIYHYWRTTNPHRRPIIKFNLDNIPDTITSTKVKLYQYASNGMGNAKTIKFFRVTSYYDATQVSWDRYPIYDNIAYYSLATDTKVGYHEYEINDLILDMMGHTNNGFHVIPYNFTANCYMYWRDASDGNLNFRPKLTFTLESGDKITFDTTTGDIPPPPTIPPTFSGLKNVTGVDNDSIRLFWDSAKDQTGYGDTIYYKVYHSTTPDGTYTLLGSTNPGSTYYQHDGLEPGSLHYYYVHAVDSSGYEDENVIKKGGSNAVPSEDTWYYYHQDHSTYRGHGHKDLTYLKIGHYNSNYDFEAILKFMINDMPDSGFESVSIDLYFYTVGESTTNYQIKYSEITSGWSELEHTYKNFPSRGDSINDKIMDQGVGWYSFDITDLYNAWKADTKTNYGVRFQHYDADHKYYYAYSTEASLEKRPRIVFKYPDGNEMIYTTSPDPAPNIPPDFSGASSTNAGLAYNEIRVYWPWAYDNGDYRSKIKYNIYRSTTDNLADFNLDSPHATVTGTTNYTDTGLTSAIDYYYVVRAEDTEGNEEENEVIVMGSAGISGMDAYGTTTEVFNTGHTEFHYIGYQNGTYRNQAMYMYFGLDDLPADVQNAYLELRCHSKNIGANVTYDVFAQKITNGWNETVQSSVSVDSEKFVTQGYSVTYNCGSDYHVYEITNVYNAWKAETSVNYGLRFYDNSPSNTNYYIRYYSFNSSTYKPRLRLIDADGLEHTYSIFNTGAAMIDVTPTFSGATSSTNHASSQDQITVTWPDASDDTPANQITYKIYRRLMAEDFTYDEDDKIGELTGENSFNDTNVAYGTLYKYNVRAFDPGGKTDGNTNHIIAMAALKGIDCNTYPWQSTSNGNCGDATSTRAWHHSHSSYNRAGNFAFDMTPLTSLDVSSMKFKAHQAGYNSGIGVDIWRITYHWNYPAVTYSKVNSNKGENYGSLVGSGWQESDITSYYSGVKDGTFQNLGFFMNGKNWVHPNGWGFYSFENTAYNVAPRLEITLTSGESFSVRVHQPSGTVSDEYISIIFPNPHPEFDGLASILPDNDGCFTLDWNDATSSSDPSTLVYDVYRANLEEEITWDVDSLFATTLAGVTFYKDCADIPDNPGTTYYYGVRARNTLGNQDTNTIIKSQESPLFAYDTYYYTSAPDNNYGTNQFIFSHGNGQYRIFFKINTSHLTNLPADVMEAKLVFTKHTNNGCTNTSANWTYPVKTDWNEDTLKYSDWGDTLLVDWTANPTHPGSIANPKWYYDITPYYNEWKSGERDNYGVYIYCTQHSSYYVYFYSLDDTTYSWWKHPYLILTLTNGTTEYHYFRPDPN